MFPARAGMNRQVVTASTSPRVPRPRGDEPRSDLAFVDASRYVFPARAGMNRWCQISDTNMTDSHVFPARAGMNRTVLPSITIGITGSRVFPARAGMNRLPVVTGTG